MCICVYTSVCWNCTQSWSQLLTLISNRRKNVNWLGRRARTRAYAHITHVQNAPIGDIWDVITYKAHSATLEGYAHGIITVSAVELVNQFLKE